MKKNKTVVITGSARGFGYAMIKLFREYDFNVVLCDVSKSALEEAKNNLSKVDGKGLILSYIVDVTKVYDLTNMVNSVLEEVPTIDIWINNAGVNQPNKPLWELDELTINRLIDIDLKGVALSTKVIMPIMIKQKSGQIFNVEGFGSDDAKMLGLSLYGTSKRAITYYTEALAKECDVLNTNVLIGKITPGIMITNFITTSLGDGEKIELDDKTKLTYNILGDYPETIASFMVEKIINNKKNNAQFTWLSKKRAAARFFKAFVLGKKHNFFD